MKGKVILPAISVGLLVTAREVPAGTIDLGVVAESLTINAGLTLNANTIGGFTVTALQFVGSHLQDVNKSGQTIDSLLMQMLGPENAGTMNFGVTGTEGASGMATFTGSYILTTSGEVTLSSVPVTATLNSCTPNLPAVQTGCASGVTFMANPFVPVGVIQSMETAQILSVPPGVVDAGTLPTSLTITIPLGLDTSNNILQGEEVETFIGTPEPSSWSLAALGAALAGWWRRRSGRK